MATATPELLKLQLLYKIRAIYAHTEAYYFATSADVRQFQQLNCWVNGHSPSDVSPADIISPPGYRTFPPADNFPYIFITI